MIKELFITLGEIRKRQGMSTYDIAKKADMNQSIMPALDKGDTVSIKRLDEFLKNLSSALDVSLDDLVGVNKSIAHLPPDLQSFVSNPANERAIKKAWMETELRKMKEEESTMRAE